MKGARPLDNSEIRSVSTCFTGFPHLAQPYRKKGFLSGSFKFLDGELKQIADEPLFLELALHWESRVR